MTNPNEDTALSQLADGELGSDELNRTLLDLLDSPERREELKGLLKLRQALTPWRDERPQPPIEVLPAKAEPKERHASWWPSLVVAALLGGVLVGGGVWLGTISRNAGPVIARNGTAGGQVSTAEQRKNVARVFAFHESVAGPLQWYAADDTDIRISPSQTGDAGGKPVAVLLRLMPVGKWAATPKTYIIVCRGNDSAAIDLPDSRLARSIRLALSPELSDNGVQLQYTLAANRPGNGRGITSSLAGKRDIGLNQTSLGQLALGNHLIDVDASAWILPEGQ